MADTALQPDGSECADCVRGSDGWGLVDHPLQEMFAPPAGSGPQATYEPGKVLIKLREQPASAEPWAAISSLARASASPSTRLPDSVSDLLTANGAVSVEPVFAGAKPTELFSIASTARAVSEAESDQEPSENVGLDRWYAVTLPEDSSLDEIIVSLQSSPDVEAAEPDYVFRLTGQPQIPADRDGLGTLAIPDGSHDPKYAGQWHLDAVNAPEAWDYLESQGLPAGGSPDVVIAVIDTGVDYTHSDLTPNMWVNSGEIPDNGIDDDRNGFVDDVHGVNVVSNSWNESGDPLDDHAHGTHVAGIIAAVADNDLGGVGVAYNSKIMAIKALQYSGVGSAADIAEGIYYAIEQGADVINMSFGSYAKSQIVEDALAVAFGQAVLVAAAGNDAKVNLPCPFGADMYPAAYNWVLGVMASGPNGSRAGFSNYDCTPHDKHEYEIMAPGVDVWSTLPGEQYAAWDGTSMAGPVVSGVAALLRTKFDDKDVYSSRFIMGQIAQDYGAVTDAYRALTDTPEPELRYLEHWLFDTAAQGADNDDDGRIDAGETIDLAIVVRNHWGKAEDVNVTLQAMAEGAMQPDPYVTMITDTVNYGAIGSFNWDDNGLVYDDQGVITGVRHPFQFAVSPDCPNDHVIPFKLTMTCENGFDPDDPNAPYAFESRFQFVVQRGRELPRIISENMTLTKDYYWIVAGQTLIESNAVVVVEPGT